MAKPVLEQLRSMTTVVSDTGDFNAIKKFKPQDCDHKSVADRHRGADARVLGHRGRRAQGRAERARRKRRRQEGRQARLQAARRRVRQASILEIVPGRVSTEVDARLSYDTEKSIAKAREIIAAVREGRHRPRARPHQDRLHLGRHPGRRAVLEKEGIHCNMTLLFGLHQAIACAEAKVTLISPFVGRILDWYKKDTGKDYQGADDPGVQSVTTIYNYYKKFGYKTEVMGASFRNIGEIKELAGCDLLTIAPKLLGELEADTRASCRASSIPRRRRP